MGDAGAGLGDRPKWLVWLAAASFALPCAAQAGEWGREYTPSVNDFGGTGLLQMPNARFHDDGELNLGVSYIEPYTRGFITLQGLPWLEGTFRYTDISNRLFGPEDFSGDQSFKDRSADIKYLLSEESAFAPQIAVQLRDLGGTDLFGSEFIVGSKRYYNWDFTFGLAWGNGGTRGTLPNPFCAISNSFCDRGESGGAGGFNVDFFRGERMAVFGGIEYLTPLEGLRLKVEYDGNDYQDEPLGNEFDTDLPVNFGAEYDLFSWLRISAALERGNQFMIRGNFHSNLNTDLGVSKLEPPPPPVTPRKKRVETGQAPTPPATTALAEARDATARVLSSDRLLEKLKRFGITVSSFDFEGRSAILRIPVEGARPTNASLANAALAVARTNLKGPVDRVTFVATRDGRDLSQTSFTTADLERSMSLTHSAIALAEPSNPEWIAQFEQTGPSTRLPEAGDRTVATITALNPPAAGNTADGGVPLAPIAGEIFAELEQQGFQGERFDIDGLRATLYFSQRRYRNPAQAIGRAARVVARHAPPRVEEISLVIMEAGVPVSRTSILRKDLENAAVYAGSPEEIWQHTIVDAAPLPDSDLGVVNAARYPDFNWSIFPRLRQQIGGPDSFYFYQLYGEAAAGVELARGLSVSGAVGVNFINNFNDLDLESDSELPHVRSDIADYLKEGKQWIDNLHTDYLTKLAPEVYGRASAGIFELMYTGVGGEVLYRPVGKRWAVGLDVNYVWQRDFNGRFGLRDYDVATGHLRSYYVMPYYDILATVSVGRYLAKDWGGTLSLSRTFDNGVIFGVFATKTNVSAKEFGEGKFDKGFFISFPLDLFFATPTRQRAGLTFRPLTRDGGQQLIIPKPLYGITDGADFRAINDGWSQFLD